MLWEYLFRIVPLDGTIRERRNRMAWRTPWQVLICLLAAELLLASCGTGFPPLKYPGVSRVELQEEAYLRDIVWSPDGRRFAATIQEGGGEMIPVARIVVVDPATGRFDLLLEAHNAYRLVQGWSPDGRQIAFAASPGFGEDSLREGIWIMNADGSGEPRFVSDGRLAAWSPGGKQMAIHDVARDPKTGAWVNSIWILDLESSEERVVFSRSAGGGASGFKLAWSPDGTRLAFAFGPEGLGTGLDRDVWVLDLRSGHLTQLTHGGLNDSPTWSPDGRLIAYVGEVQVKGRFAEAIMIARADGSCKVQALGPADFLAATAWSPDGKRIAFEGPDGPYMLDVATVLGEDFLTSGPVCP